MSLSFVPSRTHPQSNPQQSNSFISKACINTTRCLLLKCEAWVKCVLWSESGLRWLQEPDNLLFSLESGEGVKVRVRTFLYNTFLLFHDDRVTRTRGEAVYCMLSRT
jgi:hypothetical protein